MRILFDQGTPVPLRRFLPDHQVATAYEQGWSNLENGDLLKVAEETFELLITTDQNLRYQQNLHGRMLAILVLPTTNWSEIQRHVQEVQVAITGMKPGEYREIEWED
jgi:predicted nuclease of predicted toxin-antitoxin system